MTMQLLGCKAPGLRGDTTMVGASHQQETFNPPTALSEVSKLRVPMGSELHRPRFTTRTHSSPRLPLTCGDPIRNSRNQCALPNCRRERGQLNTAVSAIQAIRRSRPGRLPNSPCLFCTIVHCTRPCIISDSHAIRTLIDGQLRSGAGLRGLNQACRSGDSSTLFSMKHWVLLQAKRHRGPND
jgi:hypothetical protein